MKKINGRNRNGGSGDPQWKLSYLNFFFINPSSFYFLLIMKRHQNTPSGSFWWRFALLANRCWRAPVLFFVIDLALALRKFFEKLRVGDDELVVVVVGDGAGVAQCQDDLVRRDAMHAEKARDI